jgi:6-phosphogluconolactonase (cycloisomerase 2 family)
VTGLQSDQQITAMLNGSNDIVVDINGNAGFSAQLVDGDSYEVTITAQPATQTCSVANGSGVVQGADVEIAITCIGYTVGGTLTGLNAGETLDLELNSGEQQITLDTVGPFSFDTTLADQAAYDVAVATPPLGKNCVLDGNSGVINGADITSISVACSPQNATLSIGGSLLGLASSPVTLQQNGADDIELLADDTFSFPTLLRGGASYEVTVSVQPDDAECSVSNGSGATAGANITDIAVNCVGTPTLFAYSYDFSDPAIERFTIDSIGRLTARERMPLAFPADDMTIDPAGRRMYVGTNARVFPPQDRKVRIYDIDPATGALTLDGSDFTPSENLSNLRFHPSGRFAYGVFYENDRIALFSVDPVTGALTENATVASTDSIRGITFDQAGRHLIRSVFAGFTLYSIDPDSGSLTELGTQLVEENPYLAVDRTDRFILATGIGDLGIDNLTSHTFDGSSGTAARVNAQATPSAFPGSVSINPYGTFAYTGNSGIFGGDDAGIEIFSIDPVTGAIAIIAPRLFSDVSIGAHFEPTGRFAYLANPVTNEITAYSVNPVTGLLEQRFPPVPATSTFRFTLSAAQRFAYVLNPSNATLTGFSLDPEGTQTSLGSLANTAPAPIAAISETTGRFVFVLSSSATNGTISTYGINRSTGALDDAGIALTTSGIPTSIAAHPTGRFLYAAQQGADSLASYSINPSDGSLLLSDTLTTADTPSSLTLHPTGNFLYATQAGTDGIVAFSIDQATGIPTQTGSPIATGDEPVAAAISTSGRFAFVANRSSNSVSTYSINLTTGALTSIAAPVGVGAAPAGITVAPDGRFVYVFNSGSNDVTTYRINESTGSLSEVGTAVATGGSPTALSIDASTRFAYVTLGDDDSVQRFAIDPATGALSASGAPTPAGSSPAAVVLVGGSP